MANPTMTLIASHTTGSGGEQYATFSSIPQTYTDLVIKASLRNLNNNWGSGYIWLNGNILTSYSNGNNGFYNIKLAGSGTSASSGTNLDNINWTYSGMTTNTFGVAEIYIPNYTSSNYKSFSIDSTQEANATQSYGGITAELWQNTSAITSISIGSYTSGDGPAQYSTFYLYGIKNS